MKLMLCVNLQNPQCSLLNSCSGHAYYFDTFCTPAQLYNYKYEYLLFNEWSWSDELPFTLLGILMNKWLVNRLIACIVNYVIFPISPIFPFPKSSISAFWICWTCQYVWPFLNTKLSNCVNTFRNPSILVTPKLY